jgi:hydroxyethylthiazole kinase-like sugar kinase family protein
VAGSMSTKQIDLYLYPCMTALHKFAETNGMKKISNALFMDLGTVNAPGH